MQKLHPVLLSLHPLKKLPLEQRDSLPVIQMPVKQHPILEVEILLKEVEVPLQVLEVIQLLPEADNSFTSSVTACISARCHWGNSS